MAVATHLGNDVYHVLNGMTLPLEELADAFDDYRIIDSDSDDLIIKMVGPEEMLEQSPKLTKQDFQTMRKEGRVYFWSVLDKRWMEITAVGEDRLGNVQTCYREIGGWDTKLKMGGVPLWLTSPTYELTWQRIVAMWKKMK